MKDTHKQVSQGAVTGSLRSKSALTEDLEQLGWIDPVELCGLSSPAHWRLAKLSIQTEFIYFFWLKTFSQVNWYDLIFCIKI